MQQKNQPPTPGQSITLSDIYYVIFKHKWKIVLCSLAGFAAAGFLLFVAAPTYQSEAKLLVSYVQDSKSVNGLGPDDKVKMVDSRGDMIMSSEGDILSSLDVVNAVVDVVGAEKILGKEAGSTNRDVAAMNLKKNLTVEVPRKGNVLRVVFHHHNSEIVQPVIRALLDAYYKKHLEIHRNLGQVDDMLTQQTDQIRSKLNQTEEELRKLKTEAGITSSLEEAKKTVATRYATFRTELTDSEIELEERRASLSVLQKSLLIDSSQIPATNEVAAVSVAEKLPTELVEEYQRVCARLDYFRKQEQELLRDFTIDNPLVREKRELVAGVEKQKKEMLAANPRLAASEPTPAPTAASRTDRRDVAAEKLAQDLISENSRIAALGAKIRTLTNQVEKARQEVLAVDKAENDIKQLQRKMELEDTKYRYFSTSLDQARFDNTLGGGQASGIKEIQSPSLPFRDPAPLQKNVLIASVGGIFLGLALAFLMEFVIDQSVRKPSELDNKFNIPTFLTIPELGGKQARKQKRKAKKANGTPQPALLVTPNGEVHISGDENGASVSTGIAPWDEKHELHPYSEALRDRLVTFFEMKGLTHKPKLIALTSCSRGSGVTTLAAGLAASLSETGEGNVLLVDMNLEQGAAHPFYRGKPSCGLADVLEQDKRPAAMVQEKLYMVHGGSVDDRLPKILPKRISHLLPKLQASDYDYIIFDMPPVTQTSVTPRLAGFMDMVFLVVEDEKTRRHWLKQASALLLQSKANLGVVFNKRRNYIPKWLHQEF